MRIRIKFSKKQVNKLPGLQNKSRVEANVVLFRRVTAILMVDRGILHKEIAETLGVCREAISRWIALFLAKGAKGLNPRKSPGRKSKCPETAKMRA